MSARTHAHAGRTLAFWCAGVFAVLCALDWARAALWTYGADTGTFAQVVLDAFGGMRNGIERGTHYRYHWSPSLVALWPLMAATHSALALQFVQAAATVAAAPLVFALIAPRANGELALRAGVLTLLYPPLVAVGWGEFHEIGVLPALVLGALVAEERRRWGWFAVCILLAAGLREDVCLEFLIAGTALGLARPHARAAWFGAAAAAAVSLAVYYGVVLPRAGGSWIPAHFYVYPFANGPLALLAAPFTHPADTARALLTFGRLTYVLEALVPLAVLPLFSRWSLLALPGFAIVLLANDELVYHMGNHYAALWIPWLLAGAARALAARRALRWAATAIALCAVVLVFFNPLHPAHFLRANYRDLGAARRALACVPPQASVATHDEWFAAIAARNPRATLATTDGVDYLVYADDFQNAAYQRDVRPRLRAEVASGAYREICRFGAVATYARWGIGART